MIKLNPELKERYENLLEKLQQIGEFRRGSLNMIYRKCGKSRCVCNQPEHPGHGPQITLTYKEKGKTIIRNLSSVAAMELVREQIGNHDLFTKWCQEWRKLNEEISDRNLDEVLSGGEVDEFDRREKKLRKPSSRRSKKKLKG